MLSMRFLRSRRHARRIQIVALAAGTTLALTFGVLAVPRLVGRSRAAAPTAAQPRTPAAGHPIPTARGSHRPMPSWQRIRGPGSWRTLSVATHDEANRRPVLVFTPDVPHPARLPVLYWLHGLPAGIDRMCNSAAGRVLDAAFRAGARPFIFACPNGSRSANYDSEWADSVDGKDKLETFVVQDARRAVEGTHPRPRSMRAIGGMSMGGFACAALALRHPQLYSQVAPMAGYFHIDDPDHVFGTTRSQLAAHNPTDLVGRAKGQYWSLYEARNDHLTLTAHAAEQYLPLLRKAGAHASLRRTPGAHDDTWLVAQLGALAQQLSRHWGASR